MKNKSHQTSQDSTYTNEEQNPTQEDNSLNHIFLNPILEGGYKVREMLTGNYNNEIIEAMMEDSEKRTEKEIHNINAAKDMQKTEYKGVKKVKSALSKMLKVAKKLYNTGTDAVGIQTGLVNQEKEHYQAMEDPLKDLEKAIENRNTAYEDMMSVQESVKEAKERFYNLLIQGQQQANEQENVESEYIDNFLQVRAAGREDYSVEQTEIKSVKEIAKQNIQVKVNNVPNQIRDNLEGKTLTQLPKGKDADDNLEGKTQEE